MVLLITADLPEIVNVADRIQVMDGYRMKGEVENDRNYDAVSNSIMGYIHSQVAA